MLSNACTYGILSCIYLATAKPGERKAVGQIASALGIPPQFLSKILHLLTQEGITHSYRGASGGVELAKPPAECTVYDVIAAIDGKRIFQKCILALDGCGDSTPCPMHHEWSVERMRLQRIFQSADFASLAEKVQDLDLRLALTQLPISSKESL